MSRDRANPPPSAHLAVRSLLPRSSEQYYEEVRRSSVSEEVCRSSSLLRARAWQVWLGASDSFYERCCKLGRKPRCGLRIDDVMYESESYSALLDHPAEKREPELGRALKCIPVELAGQCKQVNHSNTCWCSRWTKNAALAGSGPFFSTWRRGLDLGQPAWKRR